MEKLSIEEFRKLKQEVIEMVNYSNEVDSITDEAEMRMTNRYKEIIGILSEHDLGDIDFEEWKGMILLVEDDKIDFSKTRANLDFSVIDIDNFYYGDINLKGCKIKNFDFNNQYYFPSLFDEEFIRENEKWFLSKSAPEQLQSEFYKKRLTLTEVNENSQYFEGKQIFQAMDTERQQVLVKLYGDDIYEVLKKYVPILEPMCSEYESRVGGITLFNNDGSNLDPSNDMNFSEDKKNEIISSAIKQYYSNVENITNMKQLQLILDFVPIQELPLQDSVKGIIEKYGIEKLVDAGIDDVRVLTTVRFFANRRNLTDIETIKNISEFATADELAILTGESVANTLEHHSIEAFERAGIKDLKELHEPQTDLYKIKGLIANNLLDLVDIGQANSLTSKEFITKYGIDNIIEFDEETGAFSHKLWQNGFFLEMFAASERLFENSNEPNKKYTYEEFRQRVYELLCKARTQRGPLHSRDYGTYDFIKGKFREEHPEIFLDADIPVSDEVLTKFYTGHMTFDDVRKNPILIKLLQGKSLDLVFSDKTMIAGIAMAEIDQNGNPTGIGIPNTVNMAKYISEKIGQETFFKICADYGKCLDEIKIKTSDKLTEKELRELIETKIYKSIKEMGIEYFEYLPQSFHNKYPELFLPQEVDDTVKQKFYKGQLSFEDIRQNPGLKEIILQRDVSVGFHDLMHKGQITMLRPDGEHIELSKLWKTFSISELMEYAEIYGDYLKDITDDPILDLIETLDEERRKIEIQDLIEMKILNRKSRFTIDVPDFFKEKHPEMFLDESAPDELKAIFYNCPFENGQPILVHHMSRRIMPERNNMFKTFKNHPEWKEYLQGKDLRLAFPPRYDELFKQFENGEDLLRIGMKNPETVSIMVEQHKENILKSWYNSTGGKFLPHHIVMLNFPEEEIDSFLENGKRWSQLMRIENYSLNDEGKSAILKAAYAMGVFKSSDDGFRRTMKLFTEIPSSLSAEEYEKVMEEISSDNDKIEKFKKIYKIGESGRYELKINQQEDKKKTHEIRTILEKSGIERILTPEKAHRIFDSFSMEYNPDFIKFFEENVEQIISNSEIIMDIATIQRQFKDIAMVNAGRRLTLDVARDYIRSIAYQDIDIGNEGVAEQAQIAGYSQGDFEEIQRLFNEGEARELSSIPRIKGDVNGYTYEMLRCDDPLALTIGTLTDCCQEIHGAGQTSMEHSVVSKDGRVFCVRDSQGRIVAQSWFWRNQYVGCFDNIEIPDKIFTAYQKDHPDEGREGLTRNVLEVYKKAAQELIEVDEKIYKEMLDNGIITQEQYDSLLLGKVTIGLGYNDIADAIRKDETVHKDSATKHVKTTERLPRVYSDASTQYTVVERDGKQTESEHENLYIYEDDIPEYDETNMSRTVLYTLKRMEKAADRDNISWVESESNQKDMPQSKIIIENIASEYNLNPKTTRVIASSRVAMIYSKEDDKIKIGDIFVAPIKNDLDSEKQQKATKHIDHLLKKSLKQIGTKEENLDISLLDEEQQEKIITLMKEIQKEDAERSGR